MIKVAREQLARIIAERTLSEPALTKLSAEIAAYLLSENRVSELESLIRDVLAYREQQGVLEADIVSAHELSDSVKTEVAGLMKQNYPHAKHVAVQTELDPEVVGGLRIRLANEQLDMTVQAKLDTFKRLTAGEMT